MTGGIMHTASHTNVCKFLNFQHTFSQLILHLKCWNLAGLLKLRFPFSYWYSFLTLAYSNIFKFSAAILENIRIRLHLVKHLMIKMSEISLTQRFDDSEKGLFYKENSFLPLLEGVGGMHLLKKPPFWKNKEEMFTVPFNTIRTLKFIAQPTCFFGYRQWNVCRLLSASEHSEQTIKDSSVNETVLGSSCKLVGAPEH